jgi:hypothetical protein
VSEGDAEIRVPVTTREQALVTGLEILADEMRPLCAEDFERARRYFAENRGPSFPIMDVIQAPPQGNRRLPFWSDLEERTFRIGDVEVTVSFDFPPCVPMSPGTEQLIGHRMRRGHELRTSVLDICAGDRQVAILEHYRVGAKHPDDFNYPLSMWDEVDPE